MNRTDSAPMTCPSRRTGRRLAASILAVALMVLVRGGGAAGQQDPEEDMLSKILTEDRRLETLKQDRLRPPFELNRTQVLPFDVLPFVKANHWSMLGLELRANHADYDGSAQALPVRLRDQPNEVIFRRDARLLKRQQARLTMPVFLPTIPKELGLQLVRPEMIRPDFEGIAPLSPLEPHQQLVVVLSNEANDTYSRWMTIRATIPSEVRRDDTTLLNKHRYYRMVLPLDPEKPLLSPHPLTWSPISHIIWDGMPPDRLNVAQQQALVDWLHWGGQLVIVGGPGPAFAPLRESFLASYLPADPSGTNISRSGNELADLSRNYPPSYSPIDDDEAQTIAGNAPWAEIYQRLGRRYKAPAPIQTDPNRPIQLTGLQPREGATVIPLGGAGDPPLAVEWGVGRGRVTMLAAALTDPDLARWPGYDTLVRRVVLRRPEEPLVAAAAPRSNGGPIEPAHFDELTGPDLTNVRFLARDLGAPVRVIGANEGSGYSINGFRVGPRDEFPVGEWLDTAALPTLARETLEQASGIEIPSPNFVLKVILAYLIALVPINWLVCRYLVGRREVAWIVVPILALGFAYGVERAAAYDVGFDSSSDEVDLIETHGDYPRAHLSRFGSIYSTGRVRYSISYPNDPTALALPLATGRSLRGEDIVQSSLHTLPYPALTDFLVQPRSLSLFRAEQMPSLPGTISLRPPGAGGPETGPGRIVNALGFDLADAWVVEVGRGTVEGDGPRFFVGEHLGAVANGAAVPLPGLTRQQPLRDESATGTLDPGPFGRLLIRASTASRPEDIGEVRLIGRIDRTMPGQTIEPEVDRRRGFTLVVAHLRAAPLGRPDAVRFNAAPKGTEVIPPDPRLIDQATPNSLGKGAR